VNLEVIVGGTHMKGWESGVGVKYVMVFPGRLHEGKERLLLQSLEM
jgi:hypothetical protein